MDQIPDLHSPMSPISESPSSPAYSTGMASRGDMGRSGDLVAITLCVYVFLMSFVRVCDYVCFYLFSESKTLQEFTVKTC